MHLLATKANPTSEALGKRKLFRQGLNMEDASLVSPCGEQIRYINSLSSYCSIYIYISLIINNSNYRKKHGVLSDWPMTIPPAQVPLQVAVHLKAFAQQYSTSLLSCYLVILFSCLHFLRC